VRREARGRLEPPPIAGAPAARVSRWARAFAPWAAPALLAVLVVAVRLIELQRESFWLDEAGRVAIASLPWAQIAGGVAVVELSPPLYHYALALWLRIAGDGDGSVRLLSVGLAVPTVFLAWWLGRAVAGPRVGYAVAALAGLSPFAVHYGQEAAMYALVLPLGLLATRAAVGVLSPQGERSAVPVSPTSEAFSAAGMSPPPLRGRVREGGVAPPLRRRVVEDELSLPPPRWGRVGVGVTPAGGTGRWLAVYVAAGTLACYTHYYAAFLLAGIGLVGVAHAVARRAWHGVALWAAAHAAIGLAFLPWLPTFVQQATLAASVEEWGNVDPASAIATWSSALLADGTRDVPAELTAGLLAVGVGLGAWRLRRQGAVMWLMLALVVVPIVLAIVASGYLHSFRERGFLAVAAAPWVLLAVAVLGGSGQSPPPSEGEGEGGGPFPPSQPVPARGEGVRANAFPWESVDRVARAALGLGVVATTALGLRAHFAEQKEDWRGAARIVEAGATSEDPIFFIHFGGQLAFDRYFAGPQPRVGLPATFTWENGYHARYRVAPEDVAQRVAPALRGRNQAWAVLSHDAGRGSELLLAALDQWGERIGDVSSVGVRVLRYRVRA